MNIHKRIHTSSLAALATMAVLACACGGSLDDRTATVPGPDDTDLGGSLVVYSGRSEELVGPLVTRFAQETGVDVEIRYGSSSEMAATLLSEGAASPADVFYAQDPASLGSVAGLLGTLPGALVAMVPERFRDSGGLWVGATARSRVLAYNPTLVSDDELPATFHELTASKWTGQVGIAPTNASFIAFVSAMILLEGEESTLSWLSAMAANEPVEFDGNAAIAAAVDAGDISVGLINHYYLLELGAEQGGTTARNHFFETPDAGSLVMPSGASILSTSSNRAAAEAFIAFLLSPDSQTYFSESVFEYPVVDGVPEPKGTPPIESLTSPDLASTDLASVLDAATDLITEAGLL
jgi:iron(III) transport system substrate-binding protein